MARLELPAPRPADRRSRIDHWAAAAGCVSDVSLDGTPVVACASHDTASAVAAITARNDTAFISSGTWSLVGIELDAPVLTPDALRLNFSNEGGVCGTTRLLKNVMGLWMLQCCRRPWAQNGREFDYGELDGRRRGGTGFRHLVDPDDASFVRARQHAEAIDRFCPRTGQPAPATPGEYARTILDSLALKYRLVIRNLEIVTGRPITRFA